MGKTRSIVADDGSAVSLKLQQNDDGTFSHVFIDVTAVAQAVHDGVSFIHSGQVTIANNSTYKHLIVLPANYDAHIYRFALTTGGPVVHALYESPTVITIGTPVPGINRNRKNPLVAGLSIYHLPI